VGNVVVAPQSLIDCTGGCGGGDPANAFASLVGRPAVEAWCDPYRQAGKACGSHCGAGNAYAALPGSLRLIGGEGPAGTRQMMLELIRGGPGVVNMLVMNDLFGYWKGVYTPSATAQPVGGHSVSLVGWGEERGVGYWICQNSWGAGWGEAGFLRLARGPHGSSIEPGGLLVVRPVAPDACPASACADGAATLRDCTCQCPFGRAGPTCGACTLACSNGGARDAACTRCDCPMGFWGRQCEGGYRASPLASCSKDASESGVISVAYAFAGDTLPPTQASFVGLYPLDEYSPFKTLSTASVCGATYPKYVGTVNGGLCPSSGSLKISRPSAPGKYKLVVAPYSPMNALGQQGYYALEDRNIIGIYTVLPADCSASARAEALAANDPAALLRARLNASAADEADKSAEAQIRLADVQPLRAALLAEPPPSLAMGRPGAVTWQGMPTPVCYNLPLSANVNPKILVLYVGEGTSGDFYPTGLGPTGVLPPSTAGCANITVSRGVPTGRYTLALEDPTTGRSFGATVTFGADRATIACVGLVKLSVALTLTIRWSMPAALATARDTVRVTNTRGDVVSWFYTSCKCQITPGAAVVSSPSGSYAIKVTKTSARGGLTFRLHPGDGAVSAALAPDWIPWAKAVL
jgi:hypothetical protein